MTRDWSRFYFRALPWACGIIIVLGVLVFGVRGYDDERTVLHFRDFKEPYGGARCLIYNCDPYDAAQVHTAWRDAGGVDVEKIAVVPYTSVYPPMSLAALAPVAALPLPVAHDLWKALITVLFAAAVLSIGGMSLKFGPSLPIAILLGAFAASSTILLMLGQISGVVIPLLVIGLTCFYYERYSGFGTACLFAAAMLKPQEAGFLLLYLPFMNRGGRRAFVWIAALSVLAVGASIWWISSNSASVNWLSELRGNVAGASAPGQVITVSRGSVGGLEQTQLQDLFSVFRDQPAFDNTAALGLSVILLGILVVPLLRLRSTRPKHLLALAAVACFTLLPVYHRQYDTRMLLLVFPAVAYLLAQRSEQWLGGIGLVLLCVAVVTTSHQYLHFLQTHFAGALQRGDVASTLLLFRPMPEITLILFSYFVFALYRAMHLQQLADAGGAAIGGRTTILATTFPQPLPSMQTHY